MGRGKHIRPRRPAYPLTEISVVCRGEDRSTVNNQTVSFHVSSSSIVEYYGQLQKNLSSRRRPFLDRASFAPNSRKRPYSPLSSVSRQINLVQDRMTTQGKAQNDRDRASQDRLHTHPGQANIKSGSQRGGGDV